MSYNNAMTEARLQNSSAKAQIAAETLQKSLELALQGFQHKNELTTQLADKKMQTDAEYYTRWQNVLAQMNQENALAEEVRQYNETLAEEQRQYNQNYELSQKQFEEEIRQYNQSYELSVKQFNEEIRQYNQSYEEQVRQFNEEIKRLKDKDAKEYALQIQQLELEKQQLAENKRQFEEEMKLKKQQLEEQKKQVNSTSNKTTNKGTSQSSGTKNGGKTSFYATSKDSSDNASGDIDNFDMASVLALGYGPIGAAELHRLVEEGLVEEYKEGGKTKFRKVTKATKSNAYNFVQKGRMVR